MHIDYQREICFEKEKLNEKPSPLFQAEMIISCMSRETRVNAGLGDPLPYFNNIPESANAMIKRAVGFNESEMSKFCNDMSTLLLRQKEDVDSAVINKGPYRLASKFRSFEVQQSYWFKMTANQREKYLRKFHEAQMSQTANDTNNSSCSSIISESSSATIKRVNISTDLVESGIQSAPTEILRSISNKAEELLNKNGSIVHAPGSVDGMAYVVESYTSVRPHYVSIAKNGKVTCQDCPNWKALKICAHAVAAAEKCGITTKYMKWILDKGPAHINMTALMTSNSSSGTGKKGGKGSTARRKGGRTAKRTPATAMVDRPAFMQSSATPQASLQESMQQPVNTPVPASATPRASQQVTSMQQLVYTPGPASATPRASQQVTSIQQPVYTPRPASTTPRASQQVTSIQQPVYTPGPASATPRASQQVTSMQQLVYTPGPASATPRASQQVTSMQQPVYTPRPASTTPRAPQQTPLPTAVNPSVGTFVLTLLQCCPPLVRTCFGCSQSLKLGGIIAGPPYDLTIVTRMGFRPNTPDGQLMFKEQNVYFHVHLNCLKMKQPYFNPACVNVPSWLPHYLTPEHVRFLREFGAEI